MPTRTIPILFLFFHFVFAKYCSSLHDIVVFQTNFVFVEASSILHKFIHPILHLFSIGIPMTKLKMFFLLVFQTKLYYASVSVHANSSQYFAMNMLSWWSIIDIIPTQTFFD